MSTVAVYNGFGGYEKNDFNERGIYLSHGGRQFWFPFEGVAYLPDYTMREVDHNASTADQEEESVLTYKTFQLSGQRLAEEMLQTQVPYENALKGFTVLPYTRNRWTENTVVVSSGYNELGQPLTTECAEIVPTPEEKARAAQIAKEYKENVIKEYFQSKRERMAGGVGRLFPTGLIKVFMDELGVLDIDDLSLHRSVAAPGTGAPAVVPGMEQLLALLQQLLSKPAAPVAPPVAPIADLVASAPEVKQPSRSTRPPAPVGS